MTTTTLDSQGKRRGQTFERRFFAGMAIVILVVTFLGFAPSYYLSPVFSAPRSLPTLVHLHGVVFTLWVLLFLAQTMLVATGRTAQHRRLGRVGVVLIALMIPLAVAVALGGMSRPTSPPGIPPLSWAAVPLLGIPVFSGLIVAALVFRRSPATHKRLMLLAMIDLLRPSVGRLMPMLGLPKLALFASLVFLVPLIVFDLRTRKSLHPATLAGGVAMIAVVVATPIVWATPAWLAFAGALDAMWRGL